MSEPLLLLTGPTASGKSRAALLLAPELGAEIVSVDSMQVYRGMDIGTAKPSPEDRARVPHHLIDVVDATEEYNVARYVADAERAIAAVRARGRRPLLVGGTPLYVRGLLSGLFSAPKVDPAVRAELERRVEVEGPVVLHLELRRVDPVAAERLHANDAKRIVRALEVYRTAGRPISQLQREFAANYAVACRLVVLRRSVDDLRARIERRVERMFAEGWVDEARRLVAAGGFSRTARQAAGYADIIAHLGGRQSLAETVERVKRVTWRIARKQMTWFRGLPSVEWVDVDLDEPPENLKKRLYKLLLT